MTKRLSVPETQAERGEEESNQDKATYRKMVGNLLYLACWTRPHFAFAVSELSRVFLKSWKGAQASSKICLKAYWSILYLASWTRLHSRNSQYLF
jgi:hypothetical protein